MKNFSEMSDDMKSTAEIRKVLVALDKDLDNNIKHPSDDTSGIRRKLASAEINALMWVLGENEEYYGWTTAIV